MALSRRVSDRYRFAPARSRLAGPRRHTDAVAGVTPRLSDSRPRPSGIISGVIASAIRLARATSTSTSALVLVAFNLIPLVGVVFWGWNVVTLLVLYWVENGIVGILNVPKMLLARGPASPGEGPLRINGGVAASNVGLVLFFLIHYGLFWFVHGVFVFALPAFATFTEEVTDGLLPGTVEPTISSAIRGPDMSAVAWGALGLAISHGASFVVNYVGRREYLGVSVARQMFAPYGRLVILHMAILLGAFVSLTIGSPVGALIVLVILKTIVDLTLHLREHGVAIGPVRSA